MEPSISSAVHSKYATAFSFPLCYATSDSSSDSETAKASWRGSNVWEDPGAVNSGSTYWSCQSHLLKGGATPSLLPPPTFASIMHAAKCDVASEITANTKEIVEKPSGEKQEHLESQNIPAVSYSAPPALALVPSRGTSATSSFSSESIPVVTTSQESTDQDGSSCIPSGTTDGGMLHFAEESEEEGSVRSAAFYLKAHLAELPSDSGLGGVAPVENCEVFGEDNLTNHSELTLSLESVLTVVPQALGEHPLSRETTNADKEQLCIDNYNLRRSPVDIEDYKQKQRHSTSSFGDTSLQSWDSHLEVDQAIEDIVEGVIRDLSIYERDTKSHSSTISREDSMVGDLPRKTSPASMSSYASSKRLEWDNGADIGYLDIHSKIHDHDKISTLQSLHQHKKMACYDIGLHIARKQGPGLLPEAVAAPSQTNTPLPAFCDVIVQTEARLIRDAQVQANVLASHPGEVEPRNPGRQSSTSVGTSSSSSVNAGSTSSVKQGCSISNSSDNSNCAGHLKAGKDCSLVSAVDSPGTLASSDLAPNLSIHGSRLVPLRDRAKCVTLSYSCKSLKEPNSRQEEDKNAANVRIVHYTVPEPTMQQKQLAGRDQVTYPTSEDTYPLKWTLDKEPPFLNVGGLSIVKTNRMKMRLPNAVKGLASRSDTPIELPRACSELNKRRLDYWLSSGFPYVPAVAPLEPNGELVERARDISLHSLGVQGSSLPPISCRQVQNQKQSRKQIVVTQAATGNGTIRKRYIVRPLALYNAKVAACGDGTPGTKKSLSTEELVTQDRYR